MLAIRIVDCFACCEHNTIQRVLLHLRRQPGNYRLMVKQGFGKRCYSLYPASLSNKQSLLTASHG